MTNPPHPVRSTVYTLVALLVGLSASACGRAEPAPGAIDPSPAATETLAAHLASNVRDQRTVKVALGVTQLTAGEATSLSGSLEFGAAGVNADLTGTVSGDRLRLLLIGRALYIGDYFSLPVGKTWLRMSVGGPRPNDSFWWTELDQAVASLPYVGDEKTLTGLTYNDAPTQSLDGVVMRGALVTVSRDRLLTDVSEAEQRRYDDYFEQSTGARLQVYVNPDDLPGRLIVTRTGPRAYPTADIRYSDWGSPVSIAAPSADQVLDLDAYLPPNTT